MLTAVPLEEKIQRVRTQAGVAKYKQPIGTIIVADGALPNLRFDDAAGTDEGWSRITDQSGLLQYDLAWFDDEDESQGVAVFEAGKTTSLYVGKSEDDTLQWLNGYVGNKKPATAKPKPRPKKAKNKPATAMSPKKGQPSAPAKKAPLKKKPSFTGIENMPPDQQYYYNELESTSARQVYIFERDGTWTTHNHATALSAADDIEERMEYGHNGWTLSNYLDYEQRRYNGETHKAALEVTDIEALAAAQGKPAKKAPKKFDINSLTGWPKKDVENLKTAAARETYENFRNGSWDYNGEDPGHHMALYHATDIDLRLDEGDWSFEDYHEYAAGVGNGLNHYDVLADVDAQADLAATAKKSAAKKAPPKKAAAKKQEPPKFTGTYENFAPASFFPIDPSNDTYTVTDKNGNSYYIFKDPDSNNWFAQSSSTGEEMGGSWSSLPLAMDGLNAILGQGATSPDDLTPEAQADLEELDPLALDTYWIGRQGGFGTPESHYASYGNTQQLVGVVSFHGVVQDKDRQTLYDLYNTQRSGGISHSDALAAVTQKAQVLSDPDLPDPEDFPLLKTDDIPPSWYEVAQDDAWTVATKDKRWFELVGSPDGIRIYQLDNTTGARHEVAFLSEKDWERAFETMHDYVVNTYDVSKATTTAKKKKATPYKKKKTATIKKGAAKKSAKYPYKKKKSSYPYKKSVAKKVPAAKRPLTPSRHVINVSGDTRPAHPLDVQEDRDALHAARGVFIDQDLGYMPSPDQAKVKVAEQVGRRMAALLDDADFIASTSDITRRLAITARMNVNGIEERLRDVRESMQPEYRDESIKFIMDTVENDLFYDYGEGTTYEDLVNAVTVMDNGGGDTSLLQTLPNAVRHEIREQAPHGINAPDDIDLKTLFCIARAQVFTDSWAETSGDTDAMACAMQYVIQTELTVDDPQRDHLMKLDQKQRYTSETPQSVLNEHLPVMQAYVHAVYRNTQEEFQRRGIDEVVIYRGQNLPNDVARQVYGPPPEVSPELAKKVLNKYRTLSRAAEKRVRSLGSRWGNPNYTSDYTRLAREEDEKWRKWLVAQGLPLSLVNDLMRLNSVMDRRGQIGDFQWREGNPDVEVVGQPASSFSTDRRESENFGPYIFTIRTPVHLVWSTAVTGAGCLNEEEYIVLGGKLRARAEMRTGGDF